MHTQKIRTGYSTGNQRCRLRLAVLLNLFFAHQLLAQWIALPVPQTGYRKSTAEEFCYNPHTPDEILPIGRGRIIYTTHCDLPTSSGPNSLLYISEDDLQSQTLLYSSPNQYHNGGRIRALVKVGENKIAWGESYGYGYFTEDLFASKKGILPLNYTMSPSFTDNYIYSPHRYYGDTFRLAINDHDLKRLATRKIHYYKPISQSIRFINDSTGYYLGQRDSLGTVLAKTSDMDLSWTAELNDSADLLRDFFVFEDGSVLVLKNSGILLRSPNGCPPWTLLASLPSGSGYNVLTFNGSNGYAGGNAGTLWSSVDSGKTWKQEQSNTIENIERIYAEEDWAYFITDQKRVYRPISQLKDKTLEIVVAPNPVSENATLIFPGFENPHQAQSRSIMIYDMCGQLVYTDDISGRVRKLHLSALAPGVYQLQVLTGTASRYLRLIKM